MKKVIIMLFMCIVLTGCTVVRIDTKSIDNILGVVMQKDNTLYNQVGKGYKYYVPRGVTYIDTTDFNEKLYSNGNYYYLYIDAVSYYYKIENKHKLDTSVYYNKEISLNNKEGYIEIDKKDKKYVITLYFNYTLFKAIVAKTDIEQTVLDASYMLSTMKFNDKVIKLMLNDDYYKNLEEEYTKFKSQKETEGFLKIAEEEINIEE